MTVFISLLAIIVPIMPLVMTKKREQVVKNYKLFHDMIKVLNNTKGTHGYYQQMGLVFELRNFPEYKDFIVRYLIYMIGTNGRWSDHKELIEEAKATINFLKKPVLIRFIIKTYNKWVI